MPGKFYITTAIDYPNSAPHMGHAYEKTVTDFYARWYRLRGEETHFLTGLDEHGQKIQEAAERAGQSPREFVDEKSLCFVDLCQKLEISNDDFIRTSEPRHHRFACELYNRVGARGDIYLGHYEGEYCVSCETYYTESQLEDGKCPVHGRPTERLKEESYFFRLGKYREWIRGHIRDHPSFIYPEARRNEILSRLDEEVRDLSISRSTFDWGVPLPDNPRHVLYVWFDALSNYISALREPRDLYDRFWPADVHVIGKDIIWFHTVIWPCVLHSAELPLPRQVYVHGFVLDQKGRKMSKELGNVVDPLKMVESHGSDVLRFYFLRAIASGQDGKFSEAELIERYHGELGNDLGNLILRVVKLVEDRLGGSVPASGDVPVDLDPAPVVGRCAALIDGREHHRALETLWSFVRRTNAYLNDRKPWKETDATANRNTLYNALEALRGITYLLAPAMPATAASMAAQLGFELAPGPLAPFGAGAFQVKRAAPLFPRLERGGGEKARKAAAPPGTPKKPAPTPIDPFARLDIRVGLIEEVREHPDAEALWVLEVNLGEDEERRTICAGLRGHVTKDELEGRRAAILVNLKTARLRGIESRGMLLAAVHRDGKVVPVEPGDAPVGERFIVPGIEPAPKSRLSMRDFEKAPLTVQGGEVVYASQPLESSTGPLRADAEDGTTVR